MAISPLSIYSNWCNPKGRFFGGGASIYIYISRRLNLRDAIIVIIN